MPQGSVEEKMDHKTELVTGRVVVAKVKGLAYSTLLKMAKDGKVPYYEVGKNGKRFVVDEVLASMRRSVK
jgi:hypothetical protein